MKQSQNQGKSKKPYVAPQVKSHGKVFQVTQGGFYSRPEVLGGFGTS